MVATRRLVGGKRLSKQSPDAVAHAEAKLRAAEQPVGNLEEKSQRLSECGKEIGDQIAALGFKVHAENDAAGRPGRALPLIPISQRALPLRCWRGNQNQPNSPELDPTRTWSRRWRSRDGCLLWSLASGLGQPPHSVNI
jgi:hypothetical protein